MICLDHLSGVFTPSFCHGLRALITEQYRRLDSGELPPGEIDFVPSASSFPLKSLCAIETVLGALEPTVVSRLRQQLGAEASVDIDIAWVRRQFAPTARPSTAKPHSWHQDGAWGFDFLNTWSAGELLPMTTLWIALDDCGESAPGLEFVREPPSGLLSLEALKPERVEARYQHTERWRPIMSAGDALLFSGDYLHRSHVRDSMKHDRHSIELRFVDGGHVPQRLAAHQFLRL